ncbi:MAG: SprT-like domain-containing protein [Candidatus Eremiobacteraeota bacterium]|nr:SprT-like domain-containing protein [Candidatus Eremiobacteraeota bacterium]
MTLALVNDREAHEPPSSVDLQLKYALLNARYFGGQLRAYRIVYNPRLTSVAGRIGHRPAVIELSATLLGTHPEAIEATLLHEMVHAWLHQHGLPNGHGAAFKHKMREVGLTSIYHFLPVKKRRSRRRYVLSCPRCNSQFLRRRKPGVRVSCARCSPARFNPHVEMHVREIM